jgi:NAD(P) transhydrogenase subunit beta
MIGMTLAVVTTLIVHVPLEPMLEGGWAIDSVTLGEIAAAIAIGAVIGVVTARRSR